MDLTGLWRRDRHAHTYDEDDLYNQVSAAHREWVAAQQYFQCVSEPELVDYAVHSISAAEEKYTTLLRRLREKQGLGGPQG